MKPFLALEASAGSGKTFALSVRFIAILLSGADAREITALTFTKKAANEMKERIVQTFLQLEEKSAERVNEDRHRRFLLGKKATRTIKMDNGVVIVEAGADITEEVLQKAKLGNKFIELSMSAQ